MLTIWNISFFNIYIYIFHLKYKLNKEERNSFATNKAKEERNKKKWK